MLLDSNKEFYTANELAELLHLNVMTIYRLCDRGELPYHSFGRAKRFAKQDIENFIHTNRKNGEARSNGSH